MFKNIEIECPYCGKKFRSNFIRKHILKEHGLTDVEWMVLSERVGSSTKFSGIAIEIVEKYLKRVYAKIGKLHKQNIWNSQFNVFHRIVSHCRQFNDTDFDVFFDNVLPWQLEHPKTVNSKELCRLCFPDSEEFQKKAYHELMEVKNPYYNHGGKFSPFSKNFVGYENMTDEQKEDAAFNRAKKNNASIVHTTSLEYWLNKGYSEEEAKKKLSERQRTFTLEKCIEKYGEEEGKRIYEDRQRRWIRSLYNRSEQEMFDLNKSKCPHIPPVNGFSYESQAMFWEIEAKRTNKEHKAWFALNGDKQNNELVFERDNGRCFYLDYCIPETMCVVEYDGLHWHGEVNKEYDEMRRKEIASKGYKILVVTDEEYKSNRQQAIAKCLDFIARCEDESD